MHLSQARALTMFVVCSSFEISALADGNESLSRSVTVITSADAKSMTGSERRVPVYEHGNAQVLRSLECAEDSEGTNLPAYKISFVRL